MTEPLAKRRRLDSGVHKPFVSPLKHRPSDPTATPPPKAASNAGIFKKPALPSTPGRASNIATPTPLRTVHTPINKLTSVNTTTTTPSSASTHSTIALQSQLTALRTSLDTLRQAQRLLTPKPTSTSNSNDSDLASLTSKWQAATRLAVEELYTSAVERMNRLGGVSAWREGERQKKERMEEWRRDDERIEEERVLSELDRELVGQIGGGGTGESDDDDRDSGDDKGGRKRARKSERKAEEAELKAAREEMVAARTEARAIARAEREEDGYEAEQKREEEEMDRARGLVGDDNDVSTPTRLILMCCIAEECEDEREKEKRC